MNRKMHMKNAAFGTVIGILLFLVIGFTLRLILPAMGGFGRLLMVVPLGSFFLLCYIVSVRAEWMINKDRYQPSDTTPK